MGSFYGLLGVTADATAEEIKLAFKRRVLQVHPDKGGSKEAFHLVYLAFETLADPEARKRYDDQRPTKLLPKQKAKPKKSKTKRAQPSEQKERTKPTPKPEHTSQTSGTSKQSASASKVFSHDKLLTKLCKLLKGLTREVRNDVIQKEFTQQQRVLLEKWMQNQHDAETETPAGETSDSQAASTMLVSEKDASDSQAATLHRGSEVVQEETCDATSSTLSLIPAQTKGKLIAQPERERFRRKTRQKKRATEMQGISSRHRFSYRSKVTIDTLHISSRDCDLPTAIEFLIILISVKQRMQGASKDSEALFRSRLEEALEQSLAEHGRSYTDLSPQFDFQQCISFFMGPKIPIFSPTVRSVAEIAKLRTLMAPMRQCVTRPGLRGSIIWHYGLVELEDLWLRIQDAMKEMYESTTEGRRANALRRLRAAYDAHTDRRARHVQFWEQKNMQMHDKENHRSRRRAGPGAGKKTQVLCKAVDRLPVVRRLLLRWRKALIQQERKTQLERRKLLQQQKKEQLKRQRLEALNQRCRKEEEALKRKRARDERDAERRRREALRKRMKVDLTMEEILGPAQPT
ncbi:DnaJ protein homolog 2 [Durusdinium trenchii]|uniref:DnaJ protein homolog 2 n=1 Tax=Durusdinium trenchii TaxID=1381693 RepID=A0ABP0HXK3_9DINO